MPNAKIPLELQASVLKLSDEGKDSEEISGWLWREHKLDVTSRSVRRLIRRRRTELADVAKSVVREELRKHLLPAIKRLASTERRAYTMAKKAQVRAAELREVHKQHPVAIAEDTLFLKAVGKQAQAANLLLHYSGLNQPDKPGTAIATVVDARQALLNRIEALASKALLEPKTEPEVH